MFTPECQINEKYVDDFSYGMSQDFHCVGNWMSLINSGLITLQKKPDICIFHGLYCSFNLIATQPYSIYSVVMSSVCPAINTLRPGQNGRHFADDILKCIFLNENV